MGHPDYDVETGSPVGSEKRRPLEDETGAVPGESFELGDSWYARTQRFAGRFKIEQRGIERVPENERTDSSLRQVGTMVRETESQVSKSCSVEYGH